MTNGTSPVWLACGLRTPFVRVDGAMAARDQLTMSVPVAQAMAQQVNGASIHPIGLDEIRVERQALQAQPATSESNCGHNPS